MLLKSLYEQKDQGPALSCNSKPNNAKHKCKILKVWVDSGEVEEVEEVGGRQKGNLD